MTHLLANVLRNTARILEQLADRIDPQPLVVVWTPEEPDPAIYYGTSTDTTGNPASIQFFRTG